MWAVFFFLRSVDSRLTITTTTLTWTLFRHGIPNPHPPFPPVPARHDFGSVPPRPTQVRFLRPLEDDGGKDFFNVFVLHQVRGC